MYFRKRSQNKTNSIIRKRQIILRFCTKKSVSYSFSDNDMRQHKKASYSENLTPVNWGESPSPNSIHKSALMVILN